MQRQQLPGALTQYRQHKRVTFHIFLGETHERSEYLRPNAAATCAYIEGNLRSSPRNADVYNLHEGD